MLKATADAEAGDGSTLVNAEDTVPPKVEFKNRNVTDKWWGVLYILSYISFITCGFVVASQAKERYIYTDGVRTGISEHYQSDVETCCLESGNQGSACYYLNSNEGRRLQSGTSKFDGDEGIFEVFIEAPEIIVGLCGLTIAIAITWFAALRFFAKQVVILSELCKIALFIVFGIYANETQSKAVCFLVAAALVGYAYWARNKILFAAKMISHSTIAMKENPSIFLGGIFAKTLYAGNAALFVYFFAESINVVKVEKTVYPASSVDSTTDFIYCDFASPSYVSYINIYLAISYLWSVLLFEKMRLSTVAGVVGSWHFHPEEKPTLWITIKNIAPSFGTLSVSALISSIAEYVNKVLNQNQSCWVYISPLVCVIAPLHILICFFGTCMKTVIQMLTKYAVILHVFTGKPFMGSAKSVFKIMSRHFKGGFVTEVTSKSVLNLGSYAFSVGISMVAWKWVDDEFDCNTLSPGGDGVAIIGYFFVLLFFVWYPVLGIYVMILLNQTFQRSAKTSLAREGENFSAWNHHWIPPLTACFVGSIAMMLFLFLSSIFLDTIDTLFLCFAIDKDNNVLIPDEAFVALVSEMPSYTGTQSESSISLKEEEPAQRKG